MWLLELSPGSSEDVRSTNLLGVQPSIKLISLFVIIGILLSDKWKLRSIQKGGWLVVVSTLSPFKARSEAAQIRLPIAAGSNSLCNHTGEG